LRIIYFIFEKMSDEAPVRQIIEANISNILIDSDSRNSNQNPLPTDFDVVLSNSATNAKRVIHRGMQWSQNLWTHNLTDWQIILSFSNDNYVTKYTCFCFPFVTFKYFAGEEQDKKEFADPQVYSYCAMLEQTLRNDLRLLSDLTEVIIPPFDPLFFVRYSPSRGLVIELSQESQTLFFKIERCSWLSNGHNVHGFGVKVDGEYQMNPNLYPTGVNIYASDSSPLLFYTRLVIPTSKELCRNRKITTFSNLEEGGGINSVELNVIPLAKSKICVQNTYLTTDDPTVINLRFGDNLQYFRLTLVDERGRIIKSGTLPGNPQTVFLHQRAISGGDIDFSLMDDLYSGIASTPAVLQNSAMITSILKNLSFYIKYGFFDARLDMTSRFIHFFEIVLF
jgi:hypothetical protein